MPQNESLPLVHFLESSLHKVASNLAAMADSSWDLAFQAAADLHMIGLEATRYDLQSVGGMARECSSVGRLWASGAEPEITPFILAMKSLLDLLANELFSRIQQATPETAGEQVPIPRIVVVDDSRVSSLALSNALTGGGFSVRTASTMQDALELFFSFVPSILVSDVFMPNVDVVELCRRFRLAMAGKSSWVVLVSASQGAELKARLEMVRPDTFVAKSTGAPAVLEAVKKLCASPAT